MRKTLMYLFGVLITNGLCAYHTTKDLAVLDVWRYNGDLFIKVDAAISSECNQNFQDMIRVDENDANIDEYEEKAIEALDNGYLTIIRTGSCLGSYNRLGLPGTYIKLYKNWLPNGGFEMSSDSR